MQMRLVYQRSLRCLVGLLGVPRRVFFVFACFVRVDRDFQLNLHWFAFLLIDCLLTFSDFQLLTSPRGITAPPPSFLDPRFVVRRIGFHVLHVFGVSGGSAEKWLRTTPHCTDGAGGTPAIFFFAVWRPFLRPIQIARETSERARFGKIRKAVGRCSVFLLCENRRRGHEHRRKLQEIVEKSRLLRSKNHHFELQNETLDLQNEALDVQVRLLSIFYNF